MKALAVILAILAFVALMAAIWVDGLLWRALATAVILGLAALFTFGATLPPKR